eukprot:7376620-Prymnesium_polylepis.2
MASGSECAPPSILRHVRSTFWKRLPSVGSWRMMSSDEKMGSRYIHARWHLIHSSKISLISVSIFSQLSIRSANGPLNGEKDIDCVITMWSSSSCWITSKPLSTKVPDS